MNRINTSKIAKLGLLLAITLILALVENMLPPVLPILPYAKIGFSNFAILAVLLLFGIPEGYLILLLKCLFSAVFSGNFAALLWSLPAGIISFSVMVLLRFPKLFSTTGLSAAGGMAHNTVQILVAAIIIGDTVFVYLPYMILAGGAAGVFTGLCCHFLVASFNKKNNNNY